MNISLNLKIVTDQRNVKSFIFLHISFLYQVKFKSLWSSCLSVEELRFSLNFVTVAEQPIESSFSFLPQVSFLDHCQGNLIDNEESEHNPEIREKHGVPICKLVGPVGNCTFEVRAHHHFDEPLDNFRDLGGQVDPL